jgi:hypothetical protein
METFGKKDGKQVEKEIVDLKDAPIKTYEDYCRMENLVID